MTANKVGGPGEGLTFADVFDMYRSMPKPALSDVNLCMRAKRDHKGQMIPATDELSALYDRCVELNVLVYLTMHMPEGQDIVAIPKPPAPTALHPEAEAQRT